nr:unnamed protein product [Callosobruchus analis]
MVGKNGSGKSAILTALVLGLGGKATLTNRGSNVKGFVKAGERSGSIEIELSNEGPMAYKPAVYGKRINIRRTLTASGCGSYKICSENGEVVSTHAKEVQNITTGLNIQVHNPVCILNQDTSRNFLNSSDSKKKFSLFMKATKLDVLEMEYKQTEENKGKCEQMLKEKRQNLRSLEDELRKLEKKIVHHNAMSSLKDRMKQLRIELEWAKVRDVELECEQEKANVKSIQKKLEDFRGSSNKRAEKENMLNSKISELQHQVAEVKKQIEVQERSEKEVKSRIDQLARQCHEKKKRKAQVQTSLQSKKSDIAIIQKEIASHSETMSKVEQEKMQKIKNVAALQDKLKGLDSQVETSKNDLFQIRSDLARRQEEVDSLRREIRQADQKIAEENTNLNALQRESGNDLIIYGRDMPRVKEMINQYKSKFKHEPRGPLGSYIKLKDKKWATAIEGYIGPANLGAFAVDNRKDSQLLQEIFRKKHDIKKNLVHEPNDCVCLYNAIEIDDPVVNNCIVDSVSPENILLIPSDDRAQELLSNRQTVPQNCRQGVTIKGDRYYPDPNYRTYASSYRRAQYLQVDTKEYMHNIENLQSKKQGIVKSLEALSSDIREQEERRFTLAEAIKKVNMARAQVRAKLDELNSAAEPELQNVQYLEQELEELKNYVTETTAELNQANEECKLIETSMSIEEEKLRQLRESTEEYESRVQSLQNEVKELRSKLQAISTSDEFDKRRIAECEEKLKTAKEQESVLMNALEKLEEKATKHQIENIETNIGNIDSVKKRYEEMEGKRKNCADLIHCLKADIRELNVALEQRNLHYQKTEKYFIATIKCYFSKILESRQFKGYIDIRKEEKTLELVVQPQHGSQGTTTTANLSGGERSFSTVAFLYSLWQCMEFPFYFLDEFDVYMVSARLADPERIQAE